MTLLGNLLVQEQGNDVQWPLAQRTVPREDISLEKTQILASNYWEWEYI